MQLGSRCFAMEWQPANFLCGYQESFCSDDLPKLFQRLQESHDACKYFFRFPSLLRIHVERAVLYWFGHTTYTSSPSPNPPHPLSPRTLW